MTIREIAGPPPVGTPVPALVRSVSAESEPEPVWRNTLGGLTYRVGDRFLKWGPAGVDLEPERARLEWASAFHPVPEVLDLLADDEAQLLVTRAVPGVSAVAMEPRVAARALGEGLRAMHETLPVDRCPFGWSTGYGGRAPELPVEHLVVAHGDACLPNTLVDSDGRWSAHVDLGQLGLADRWGDLAVASASLDWNLGEGWQGEFFAAYGIARDEERIHYYRELWDLADA